MWLIMLYIHIKFFVIFLRLKSQSGYYVADDNDYYDDYDVVSAHLHPAQQPTIVRADASEREELCGHKLLLL